MPTSGDVAPILPFVASTAARRFGDRPAFVDPDGTITSYAALERNSDEVAAGMARVGVRRGSVVALTLASDTAYVIAYLAATKLGAAAAGINPRLTGAEQQRCLDVAEPHLVVTSADDVRRLAVPGGRPGDLRADADRPVVIVFTSGTTGQPKGAWFTDRQLAAVTSIDVGDAWGDADAPPSPMLAATQFAHVGFMTKLPWYLRLGLTTHLLARWRAADALDLIEREQIPSIGGVAPQVALMLRDPALDERDLSHVHAIVMGGGPSAPSLVTEARDRFKAAYSIRYSSTESGGVGTGTAFDASDEEALHTVGRPRAGIRLAIRNETGEPVPGGSGGPADDRSNNIGEVWIHSPATMAGYWRDPETTATTVVDGWLRTGDLGRIDASGCLVLAGRSSEMFIRGGYNVFPAEVEAVLGTHPGVAAVAVVPRPDDVMGEVGVAVVVPTGRASVRPSDQSGDRSSDRSTGRPSVPEPAGRAPTLAELRSFAASSLAAHKLPEAILMVDELPLTAMQKLDRRTLARLVSDEAHR